jgi:hypothetical protein
MPCFTYSRPHWRTAAIVMAGLGASTHELGKPGSLHPRQLSFGKRKKRDSIRPLLIRWCKPDSDRYAYHLLPPIELFFRAVPLLSLFTGLHTRPRSITEYQMMADVNQ